MLMREELSELYYASVVQVKEWLAGFQTDIS
jgi:hypothetical protein